MPITPGNQMDGDIGISSMPDPVNVEVAGIPDPLNVEITSVPQPIIVTEAVTAIIPSQNTVNVSNTSTTLVSANAARKYILIQNQSAAGRVFVHFGAAAATTTNGFLLTGGDAYEFPDGIVYTGEIRAISDTAGNKAVHVTEG